MIKITNYYYEVNDKIYYFASYEEAKKDNENIDGSGISSRR